MNRLTDVVWLLLSVVMLVAMVALLLAVIGKYFL